MHSKFVLFTFISLLPGCASTPDFDITGVDQSLTPQSVVAEPEISRGKTALWGGTILDMQNLKDSTRIEVLAYPLDSSRRPLMQSKPQGRFILYYQGYLEPTSYVQGRVLTVLGEVTGSESGNVGESVYTYAVINSQRLHLWSLESGRNRTSFHFGLGIGL